MELEISVMNEKEYITYVETEVTFFIISGLCDISFLLESYKQVLVRKLK